MKKEFKLSLADLKIVDGDRGINYPKKTDFKNEGYCLFLNAGNITKNGFNDSRCEFITKEKSDSLGKGIVQENDIILTTRGSVGNFVYIDSKVIKKYPIIRVNSGMVIIRNYNNDISTEYLYYLLNSNNFSKEIDKNISGGVLKQLPINVIKKMNVIYAEDNKEAQIKTIKNIIKTEFHINNIKNLLKKIEIRNQYYADKLLNGNYTVKNMNIIELENLNYKNIKLKDLVDISIGSTPQEDFYNGDVPWITISDLGNNNFEDSKKKLTKKIKPVEKGSLLISFKLSVGVAKITKNEVCTNEAIIRIEPSKIKDNVSISYLYHYLPNVLLTNAGKNAYGANILNTKQINNLDLKVFQDYSEITMFLDKLDEEKEKIEKLLKLEEQRFEWLSDKLLSGEYIIED